MSHQSDPGCRWHQPQARSRWVGILVVLATLLLVTGCTSHVAPTSTSVRALPSSTTSAAAQTSNELIPALNAEALWGYIDQTGKWVIKPQFYIADSFSEGLADVVIEDKQGYIDQAGHIVITPQYISASPFSEGLALVSTSNRTIAGYDGEYPGGFTWIDKTGRKITTTTWDDADSFSEGLAPVKKGGFAGYVDKTGKVVIALKFEYASSFSEELAAVRMNGKWGYIDKTGAWVITPQFQYLFNQDLSRPGLSQPKGSILSNTVAYGAGEFSEGLAPVAVANSKGGYSFHYIDKTGKKVFGTDFELAGSFSEGLAPVVIGHKWGYIGLDGKVVIEPQFQSAYPESDTSTPPYNDVRTARNMIFQDGLAAVGQGGKVGYIDTTGKFVVAPQFDYVAFDHTGIGPSDAETDTVSFFASSSSKSGTTRVTNSLFIVIGSGGKVIYRVTLFQQK